MQTEASPASPPLAVPVTPAARYDFATIALHWLTAALVVLLWCIGQGVGFLPHRSPLRATAWSLHILLGVTLAMVLLARIAWRSGPGARLPAAGSGWLGRLATATHYGLYALLVATVVLGVINAWVRGSTVFGLFTFPHAVPGEAALRHTIFELHADLADLTVIVAGLHAAAALAHHYVLRDSVLRRMLPGASPGR
jgi:cytochrome b561